MLRTGGEDDGIDGAGRRAADDGKRVRSVAWQQFGQGFKDPGLEGTTGPAAWQHKRGLYITRRATHAIFTSTYITAREFVL